MMPYQRCNDGANLLPLHTIQHVRTAICTIEGLQQVPHVRDGLVLGRPRPNAKAPSNIRPCLKKIGRFFPIRGSRPVNAPMCTPLRKEDLEVLTERRGEPLASRSTYSPNKGTMAIVKCKLQNTATARGNFKIGCIMQPATFKDGVPGRKAV